MTATTIHNEASRAHAAQVIGSLSLDKRWKLVLEPEKKRRTNSQLKLMWMWVDRVVAAVSEHTGYTKSDVDDYLRAEFWPVPLQYVEIGGRVHEKRRSTKDLGTADMAKYTDEIYRWASQELGLFLPLPQELHRHD